MTKKRLFRGFLLITSSLLLVGCATRSLELNGNDKGAFYDPPKDKTLASIYLSCGRNAKNGEYDAPMLPSEATNCDYKINNTHYSAIYKGEVGRVDISAGKFTLNNSSGFDPSKTLEVKPGEKILLVTDHNIHTPAGASFGLVGMAVTAIATANDPPIKNLHAPLTIYKNEFMNQISMKTPVKVIVVEDK